MTRPAGFTLVELLVSMAILGMLAAAAWPLAQVHAQRQKEQALRQALREIRQGLDAYHAAVVDKRIAASPDKSGYPETLQILEQGVANAKDPDGRKLYFLRKVPRDPFFPDPSVPGYATWGTRSYASPPDQPEEGDDVFDVFSLSQGTGMNGVPYAKW